MRGSLPAALTFLSAARLSEAWVVHPGPIQMNPPTRTLGSAVAPLALAKSKGMSKQAALRDKLAQIQEAKRKAGEGDAPRLSDEEIKAQNDRKRFEELLRSQGGGIMNDFTKEGYLTREQEEENANAAFAGVDRLFEGDPAPVECFQELVSIRTENAMGADRAADLIPWLNKNPHKRDDYLVIFCDPRPESPDLRASVKSVLAEVPADILKRLIVVNADSPSKNRRWLKKDDLEFSKLVVYSDEKMEFMRAYTALGEKRWSMTMFVIANERVQKIARDVDRYGAAKTIRFAVKSLMEKDYNSKSFSARPSIT